MKTIVPNYYQDFSCIAGKCRHSCCIGWEIDIDEESLARFECIHGEIGARLKENICRSPEGAYFRMGEDERCPFLNRDGLCDLILNLGEESLCQICADHPRFRSFFSNREEIGLGLCCEAAGKLILSQEDPCTFIAAEDDGTEEPCSEDEEILLQLRGDAIACMQNRTIPLSERVKAMFHALELPQPEISISEWIDFLLKLERLDEAWAQRLLQLRNSVSHSLPCRPELEIPLEQMMVYLLMRHLPGALEDGDISGRLAFCTFALHLVNALCSANEAAFRMDEMIEIARMFSSEIEYSDENIYAILDELHRKFPEI